MQILFQDFCNGPYQLVVKSISYDRATNYIIVVDDKGKEYMAKPWEMRLMTLVPDLIVMNAVILDHDGLKLIRDICGIQAELRKNVHEVFELEIMDIENEFTESDLENTLSEEENKVSQ